MTLRYLHNTLWTLALAGVFAVAALAGPAVADEALERTYPPAGKAAAAKLIETLKSNAPLKDKCDACRQLALVATPEAIPALAGLLGDEKLADMARYALEPIPDAGVDAALRDAVGKLSGRPLVGVIQSLGMRRDAKAVDLLAGKLNDGNAQVVRAAARSLGSIGTVEAAKPLGESLAAAKPEVRLAIAEGLLRAAESLAASGNREAARAIYDQLSSQPGMPHQVATGALRGLALVKPDDAAAVLRPHLTASASQAMFLAALRVSREVRGPAIGAALRESLGGLPPDRKIAVLQAIGSRRRGRTGQPAPEPTVVVELAKSAAEPKPVRLAAIRVCAEQGTAKDALFALCNDADRDVAQAAQEGLASMADRALEDKLAGMVAGGERSQRLLALELLARCRATSAFAAVLRACEDNDADVRRAALKRVGRLGAPADLPKLVELLARAKADDADDAKQAIRAVCINAADAKGCVGQLAGLIPAAADAQKLALLRLVGDVGSLASTDALPLLEPHLQTAALRDEAAAAIATIAEKLLAGGDAAPAALAALAGKLVAPLQKAVDSGAAASVTQRAKKALEQAKAKAGK